MALTTRTRRIARARQLIERYRSAEEILSFYAKLTAYQDELHERTPSAAGERLLVEVSPFLAWLDWEAPEAFGRHVADLRRLSPAEWRMQFDRAFADTGAGVSAREAAACFVAEALLQPSAEETAARRSESVGGQVVSLPDSGRCPSCGAQPVAGALREEGHGTRRVLICVRCAFEWTIPRVGCAGCGEDRFSALPVFTAEQFPHLRVEACDRCRRYLKTVDLSKDGHAIPQVDDLASLPLDLWARAEGYSRLRVSLLRL